AKARRRGRAIPTPIRLAKSRQRPRRSRRAARSPGAAAAPMISPLAGSIHGSQPSLEPLCEEKHANTDQDHEADRGIHSGKIVPLGKLVDKLPKTAEIDQKFDSHDIDEREDQTEPQSNKDGRQRGGKQNLPELLRWCQIEALADVDQHAPRRQK